MHKAIVQRAIRSAADEIGIKKHVTVHTLRHSYATHLLEAGGNLRLGEKYLNPDSYFTGEDWGDNHNVFSGDDMEIVRFGATGMIPAQDRPGLVAYFAFGSAHATGCHMAMCDGSVRQIAYTIDFEIHRRLSNRRDELIVDAVQ